MIQFHNTFLFSARKGVSKFGKHGKYSKTVVACQVTAGILGKSYLPPEIVTSKTAPKVELGLNGRLKWAAELEFENRLRQKKF